VLVILIAVRLGILNVTNYL